ncbi:MAG: S-layer homology domain-containing protein, partial [Oscillospiraceae bacterium]
MYRKSTRWISVLMALILCSSLFTLPALAAEEGGAAADETTEGVVQAQTDNSTMVNVIEWDHTETDTAEPEESPVPEEPEESPVPEEPEESPVPEEPEESPVPEEPEESPVPEEPEESPAPEEPEESPAPEEPDSTEEASDEASAEPMDTDSAGETGPFKISYYNGSTLLAEETVEKDAAPANAPATADGKPIKAWLDADGKLVTLADLAVKADASYYAWFMPELVSDEHTRYISGTGNAQFSPRATLTRAQAAVILYRLLDSTKTGPYTTSFSDVSATAWYATEVKTLASLGVINGYKDGTFRPNNSVTRAEFVTMLVNLTGVSSSSSSFSDVSATHWAKNAIFAAASQGWVNGYEDGTFRPNNKITRAEAVVVMNRVLGRSADKNKLSTGTGILHYLDVQTTDWWYADVMEASIGHTYTKSGSSETWNSFNVESIGLTPGLHKIGTSYVYVNSNQQLTYVSAGITRLGNGYYFAKTAGYTLDADLSSKSGYVVFADGTADQALTDGFNRIGTALFHWSLSKKAPTALTAGLNPIAGKTYWADSAGYIIRNNFGGGLVKLGDNYYLSDGYCAIITSGIACAEGYETSKPSTIDLKNHTVEFNGSMYFLNSDYTVARDTWKGYLYFGSNGKYTSGDATLDGYVYNFVKSILANNAITQEQQLLKAYYALRGGEGTNYVSSGFVYRNLGQGYARARYNEQKQYSWAIECAKTMFSKKYGECYHWAAALLFCARRLGFRQSYLVVGGVGSTNNLHCWCMIKWSGKWHISDVELEYGWLSGWYQGGRKYWDLFGQVVPSESISR